MCSETFLRLPEEKRTRFLNAAWDEFIRVPFAEASINKIVLRAHIPRGSFYQYFADKEDLFFYLLSGLLEHFCAEYNQLLIQHDGDIFQTQIDCFDRVLAGRMLDPMFSRGTALLRRNSVFLLEHISHQESACQLWEAVREHIDHRMFHDAECEKHTFFMSLLAVFISMTDAMAQPDRAELYRQELLLRLNLLKNGSLAERPMEVCL